MNLLDVIKAANKAGSVPNRNHSFLIYGETKTGKTTQLATILRCKAVKRLFLFDVENSYETIIWMYNSGQLTDEEVAKVTLIRIPDTREEPIAIETLLKCLCSRGPKKICEAHGKVDCLVCSKAGNPFITFDMSTLTSSDAIAIDSLSQVGTSAMAAACLGKPAEYKPTFDEYGMMGKWLSDLCSTIQAAKYCQFFCTTHVVVVEEEGKPDKIYPMCGTKAFSMNLGKYFGTLIKLELKLKSHRASSTPIAVPNGPAGSRLGIALEKQNGQVDLGKALIESKFFSPNAGEDEESTEEVAEQPTEPVAEKPSFLAGLKKK